MQEKRTTFGPININILIQGSIVSTTYIITLSQRNNISIHCLASTFALELADLTSWRKKILIPIDN